jgi:hypothetical protein
MRSTLAALLMLSVALPHQSVQLAVTDTYLQTFGQRIERPAVYNTGPVCQERRARLTTTAYLRASSSTSRLLTMWTTSDGTDATRSTDDVVLTPAGTIRTLVAFMRYAETVGDEGITEWERGQAQINEDYAAFAKRRGYKSPIVAFDNTNVVLAPTAGLDPADHRSVRTAVQRRGFKPEDYQLVISINMDPVRFAGGFSNNANRFIHVGNYFNQPTLLTPRQWGFVARTAYHHEVAHQWGWPGTHDWDARCETAGSEPFIVPPMLLGWEDTDGDGVPEILDATPYGRRD